MAHTLVDTSAWILAIHRRDRRAKTRLVEVVSSGEAAVCPMILLEWLAGSGRGEDPQAIRERFSALIMLECSPAVWERAYTLSTEARRRGHTLPASDSLIAAHALIAEAILLHADGDFTRIAGWSGLRQESLLRD